MWQDHHRTSLNGMVEPLLSFFLPKAHTVCLIDGIHPGSSDVATIFEHYQDGVKKLTTEAFTSKFMAGILNRNNKQKTQVLFKIRDFISIVEHAIRFPAKTDVFIGLESIYTIIGILLKKIGRIKTVVYYVSDYSPKRYGNRIMNSLYLRLDRFCCDHTDYIWDLSPAMMPARIESGYNRSHTASHFVVPNGLFNEQIVHVPLSKRSAYSMVFAGALTPENGPDLCILALPAILRKYPKTTLHFFGGPPDNEAGLLSLAKKLNVTGHTVFHGLESNTVRLSRTISRYCIGLAPYRQFEDSVRWYADSSKIRLYMGSGLPIITTKVPPLGKTLGKAGLIIPDNGMALAEAVIKLFSSNALMNTMMEASENLARNNTWEKVYDRVYRNIL
jgi:glycosyltransferase involved in cell wall biosynthesis